MKKVTTYITLVIFFLSITSCDFMRRVAGRPTSAEIAAKSEALELRRQQREDSLRFVAAIEAARRDSLVTVARVREAGVKISDKFFFGEPLQPLEKRYNLIIGVYRTSTMASKQIRDAQSKGFSVSSIFFKDGIRALCLVSDDDLKAVADVIENAVAAGVLPKDAWIYENHR